MYSDSSVQNKFKWYSSPKDKSAMCELNTENTERENPFFNSPVDIERNKSSHPNKEKLNCTGETLIEKNESFDIKLSPKHNGFQDQCQFIQHKNMNQGQGSYCSTGNASADWFSTMNDMVFLTNSYQEEGKNSVKDIFQDNNDIVELGRRIEESMSALASLLDDPNNVDELLSLEEQCLGENIMCEKRCVASHFSAGYQKEQIGDLSSNETTSQDVPGMDSIMCQSEKPTVPDDTKESELVCLEEETRKENVKNADENMHVPESETTELSENSNNESELVCLEEESLTETVKNTDENMNVPESQAAELSENSYNIHRSIVPAVTKRDRNFLRMDKKDMCLYCGKNVGNFGRHLERKHPSEPEVLKFQSMEPGSRERRRIIQFLRKKGNFLISRQGGIKLARRTSKSVSADDVFPCLYCNGFYMKSYLPRHRKKCWLRPEIKSKKKSVTPELQTTKGSFKPLDSDGGQTKLDEISQLVKSEPLISSFSLFYSKRKKCVEEITNSKLKELGRFWCELRKHIEEDNFYDALKPENFKFLIISIKNLCGFNSTTGKFHKSPSLAIHMAKTLKLLCDHAIFETKQRNQRFTARKDCSKKINTIRKLKEVIIRKWRTEFNIERTINPSPIDLTLDIVKLNEYIKEKANYCLCLLGKEKNKKAFNELQKCCLGLLSISNELKLSELEKMELEMYSRAKGEAEIVSSDHEEILLRKHEKILVRGENNDLVPVFISDSLQKYLTSLLEHRELMIPSDNIFLFASTLDQTSLDGLTCLTALAAQSGITFPQILSNGKFRGYIASVSRIFYLDGDQMEQLCDRLGYTESTHQDYYSVVPHEIYRIATLLKLLHKFQINNLFEELHSEEEEEDINSETDEQHYFEDNQDLISIVKEEVDIIEEKNIVELCLEDTKDPLKIESMEFTGYSEGKNIVQRKKHTKIKWTEKQKNTTKKYFQTHIQMKKPPIESEVMIFKEKHPFMDNKTWQQIKAFVYNIYRRM